MVAKTENERLTQMGAGTPMGNLMRRYWHPVAATAELESLGKGWVIRAQAHPRAYPCAARAEAPR